MSLRGCSSDVAKRGFCAGCGSTISYDGDDDSEVIWLTAGTHNDAGCLPQREHVYVEDSPHAVATRPAEFIGLRLRSLSRPRDQVRKRPGELPTLDTQRSSSLGRTDLGFGWQRNGLRTLRANPLYADGTSH